MNVLLAGRRHGQQFANAAKRVPKGHQLVIVSGFDLPGSEDLPAGRIRELRGANYTLAFPAISAAQPVDGKHPGFPDIPERVL